MKFWQKKRVFLDYASTTPIDRSVLDVMKKHEATFANPSALYTEALLAKDLLKQSREKIADILHCQKEEIVFTSGGTEGNNLAIMGVFEAHKKDGFVPHFITTNIEHPAVLEVFDEIERRGGKVTKVSVNEDGVVRPKDILEAITENTVLVSVMYANNEIGTIQPVREIAKIIKEYKLKNNLNKPYFHTDACQAGLYLSLDTQKLGADLLTLDGIKIYGPRSSGLLFVKNGTEIKPIMFGGGQEKGLRSGTENLTSVLGLSQAIEIAEKMRESESERLKNIRDYAIENILKTFPKATLNGSAENRLPNNINICFPNLDAEFAVISLDVSGFAVSYSSSCRNLKEDSSSYVVEVLGKTNCSQSSLRITLGRESRKSDIDNFIVALKKIVLS